MKITAATAADIGPLAVLWHDAWHEVHAAIVPPGLTALRVPAEFQARTTAHLSTTFVGRVDRRIAGFVMVEADEIYQLYTAPAVRGSGAAQALMAHGEACIATRYPRGWLACSVGNTRAARFYEKTGWAHAGMIDLPLETSAGPFTLRVWRFEKQLRLTA